MDENGRLRHSERVLLAAARPSIVSSSAQALALALLATTCAAPTPDPPRRDALPAAAIDDDKSDQAARAAAAAQAKDLADSVAAAKAAAEADAAQLEAARLARAPLLAGPERYQLPTTLESCVENPPICGAHLVDFAAGTVTAIYTRGGDEPGWFARTGPGEATAIAVEFVATPAPAGLLTRAYVGSPGAGLAIAVHPRPDGVAEVLALPEVTWIGESLTFHGGRLYAHGTLASAPGRPGLLEIDPITGAARMLAIPGRAVFDVLPGDDALILSLTRRGGKEATIGRYDPARGELLAELALPAEAAFKRLCRGGPMILNDGLLALHRAGRVYASFLCVPGE